MQFNELNLMPELLRALNDECYTIPTEIQEQAIPPILLGRDLLGSAQTGTGKTAAFALPTLQILTKKCCGKPKPNYISSLILTPTRELAIQIFESFQTYGKYLKLRPCVIFGGVSQLPQEKLLAKGVDILIATPGRLNDLINQGIIDLSKIEILILDEADRMLDMGFIHDVRKIISKTPTKKQTLLFSATMPKEIADMANFMLINPIRVAVKPVSSTVDSIAQSVYFVDKCNKMSLLLELLKNKDMDSVLVFTRTKHGADKVVKDLAKNNIPAQAIHGNKSQTGRQMALKNFKDKTNRVLVATDIAARGIDIDELSYVLNYDLPNIPETYVHRIGRTGRAGLEGKAISFCDFEEKTFLMDIEKLIGKRVPEVKNHLFPLTIMEILPKATKPRRKPNDDASLKGKRQSSGTKPSKDFDGTKSHYAKSHRPEKISAPKDAKRGYSSLKPRSKKPNYRQG